VTAAANARLLQPAERWVHIRQEALWEDASHRHLGYDLFIGDARAVFVLDNDRVIVVPRHSFDFYTKLQRETTYQEGTRTRKRKRAERVHAPPTSVGPRR
jgi:hypothetical protein